MPIRVNRVLSKKANIAGIPADVFLPCVALDFIAGIVLCVYLQFPFINVALCCLALNITWAILCAKGAWQFLGTFYHPPRYYRQNIRYEPFLDRLIYESPKKKSKKRKSRSKQGQRKHRRF
jgi:hypothetical protein